MNGLNELERISCILCRLCPMKLRNHFGFLSLEDLFQELSSTYDIVVVSYSVIKLVHSSLCNLLLEAACFSITFISSMLTVEVNFLFQVVGNHQIIRAVVSQILVFLQTLCHINVLIEYHYGLIVVCRGSECAIALAFTQYEKELTWKVTKHKREVKQKRERKEAK